MQQMKDHPTIALASCTGSAIAIATIALAYNGLRGVDIVMNVPLLPNPAGYVGFEPLIKAACISTNALLRTGNDADLAVSVSREWVSYRSSGRCLRTFSVGLIVACYQHGPLFVFQAEDWILDEERKAFEGHAQQIIDLLQKDVPEPPTNEIVEVAKLVGMSLMRLPLDVEQDDLTVH